MISKHLKYVLICFILYIFVQISAFTVGGVKSFLERFGERCQERNQGSDGVTRTPAATPSSANKSRLLQERLAVTQGASTTALLTQKQKMVSYFDCSFGVL